MPARSRATGIAAMALVAAVVGAGAMIHFNSPGAGGGGSEVTQPHDTPPVEVALGLPGNGVNPPGLYAWGEGCDGQDCTTSTISSDRGGVTISIGARDWPFVGGETPAMIAGHIGWFRRVAGPEPFELWIVDIDGVRIVITLRPWRGASEAVLAEAHAIVDSLRYQPSTLSSHGFRLVFRLSAGDWHFG